MTTDVDDILPTAADWLKEEGDVALATVIQTWGSSPRPIGSQMVLARSGRMAGSVSGGCIEGAVAESAQAVLADGRMQVLSFGVSDEAAWEVGLACGGRLQVMLERVSRDEFEGFPAPSPAILARLVAACANRRPIVLATRLPDGFQTLVSEAEIPDWPSDVDPLALGRAAVGALATEQSGLVEIDGHTWFMHAHLPPYRLIIVGAVHIAQALTPLARLMGYAVTIVDPRRAFNSAERFADVDRSLRWPDEAVAGLAPDRRTAVVALTHDPKLDDPALDQALRSEAGYVGALGSRKSQASRLARLSALGHAPEVLARLRGPVGLALGAVSASEIALSILGEIVAVRRGSPLGLRAG